MNRSRLLIILLALAAAGLFFWLDLGRYLTLESLKANHQELLAYYEEHALLMIWAFMLVYIVQTALALPGATIMALSAGAVFGPWWGTLYAVSAATVGAVLSFLVSRYLLREAALRRFGGRLDLLNTELDLRGLNYLLFLRLVPLFPFFLINLAAGVTRLRLSAFALGTAVGIIPGGFVYVNAGASLASISALNDIVSLRVLGSFTLLGGFALIPALYSKFRST